MIFLRVMRVNRRHEWALRVVRAWMVDDFF